MNDWHKQEINALRMIHMCSCMLSGVSALCAALLIALPTLNDMYQYASSLYISVIASASKTCYSPFGDSANIHLETSAITRLNPYNTLSDNTRTFVRTHSAPHIQPQTSHTTIALPYQNAPAFVHVAHNTFIGTLCCDDIGLNCDIYDSCTETVLQRAVGHVAHTGLPAQGQPHCVLAGHSGLAGNILLSNLEAIHAHVCFKIITPTHVFTYEVIRRSIVRPEDVHKLIDLSKQNLVTLITCTPFGVNSHRLLVTGQLQNVCDNTQHSSVSQLPHPHIRPLHIIHITAATLLCLVGFVCFRDIKRRKAYGKI